MNRWDLLNILTKRHNLKSYLEIGLDDGYNFNQVQCESKESCDPYGDYRLEHDNLFDNSNNLRDDIRMILTYRMTSDEMFEQNNKKYDLIFIDGLHERHQVLRDIKNSLDHLNKGGYIVMHDCLPPREECQVVPRVCEEWNGDVWKVLPYLKSLGVEFCVVDDDYGLGIIKYQKIDIDTSIEFDFNYDDYFSDNKIRNRVLNVISVDQFLEQLEQY